jgi:hypothetical protein
MTRRRTIPAEEMAPTHLPDFADPGRRSSHCFPSSRSPRTIFFGLIILCASFAVSASPALGSSSSHVFTTSFGSATSTPANPYPLSGPADVAVDQTSHDVYVVDSANHRVEKFNSSGSLLLMFGKHVNKTQVLAEAPEPQQNVCVPSVDECQTGAASSTPGAFNTPAFIAVDNSTGPNAGDVYVADTTGPSNTAGGIVSQFEPTGHLIASWSKGGQLVRPNGIDGIAVDSAGELFVMSAEYQQKIYGYSQNGQPPPVSEAVIPRDTRPYGLAVDASDDFYKIDGFPEVTKFHESEELAEDLTGSSSLNGLATDPISSDLYVDESGSVINHFAWNCGEHCPPLDTFGSGHLSGATGLSVDAPSDDVYVANTGENDIAVFDGVAPIATTGTTSPVDHTTATLTGHLSEGGRGEITNCHFEYGTSSSYEDGSVPCEPTAPYGSEADVTAQLTGLQPETTYHYRLVASNANGTADGADRMFTPHFVLGVSTEAAVNLSNDSAELTGSYTGDGTATKYYFQYGTDQNYGHDTAEQAGGTGVGPQAATPASLTGLQPFTTYHYRLVATNTLGTTYGQDRTLTTFDRPAIGTVSSSHVTATSAELHAQINPRGGDTKYHFEYGPTTGYGTSTPSPAEDIGSTPGEQEIGVQLTNLQVGATYHFRLVAENGFGKAVSEDQDFSFYPPNCPNATVRQETASNYLPDCRGYELVSPANAGGTSLYPEGPNSAEASNPSRLAFGGFLDTIPGTGDPVNVLGDLYVSTRTNEGWVTRYVGFPGNQTNGDNGPPAEPNTSPEGIFLAAPSGVRTDANMNKFLDWNDADIGFAGPIPGIYFAPHVWSADGTAMGEWPTVAGYPPGPILSQSSDFSHYYFLSGGTVTRYGEYEEYYVYEGGTAYDNNTEANTISPISQETNGTPLEIKGVPQVSKDGSRILMSTAPCLDKVASSCSPGELYMRANDALTYDIAKGHVVQFVGMTSDGSKVYFTSHDQLTSDDHDTSTDLYMWSAESNSLTLVSTGSGGTAGNSDACSASWTERCGIVPIVNNIFPNTFAKGEVFGNGLSDNAVAANNGDIYFYSPEQLDGAKGVADQDNLYVYRNGAVKYVTTLEPGSFCENVFSNTCSEGPIVRIQVSPDDSHMAFVTASQVTSYDNAKHTEMYGFDPASEEVTCVSCRQNGEPPTSDVWASSNGVFMSNDGRTFFSTGDSLVPRDTDGLRDVYEYVEGRAQLISSGTSSKEATRALLGINNGLFVAGLVGVSTDGANVFFSTYDTLVPQDRNGGFLKFYDARTDGGFPFIAPPAPCEAADECVGNDSLPPAVPRSTSGAELGSRGNVSSPVGGHHPRTKKRHHPKRRLGADKQRRHGHG